MLLSPFLLLLISQQQAKRDISLIRKQTNVYNYHLRDIIIRCYIFFMEEESSSTITIVSDLLVLFCDEHTIIEQPRSTLLKSINITDQKLFNIS